MIRNSERERILTLYCELYFPGEEEAMVRRMPIEANDPDGKDFEEYFNMIQTIYNSTRDTSLSKEDLENLQSSMSKVASKYGYPAHVLIDIGE